jgi:hypothetical protein
LGVESRDKDVLPDSQIVIAPALNGKGDLFSRFFGRFLDGWFLDGRFLNGWFLDGWFLDGRFLNGRFLDGWFLGRGGFLGSTTSH